MLNLMSPLRFDLFTFIVNSPSFITCCAQSNLFSSTFVILLLPFYRVKYVASTTSYKWVAWLSSWLYISISPRRCCLSQLEVWEQLQHESNYSNLGTNSRCGNRRHEVLQLHKWSSWHRIRRDVITAGIRGIAVRPRHTAKAIKRTAKVLPCIFLQNARQRTHDSKLHGKRTLPCAFYRHARQSFAVRQFRRTAKNFEIH
jgi:hypothetical protein